MNNSTKGNPMKDLNYYMNLPWKISFEKIPHTEGGGFIASIPQLGALTFQAHGETKEDAIKNLQSSTAKAFQSRLDNNIPIEEPK
jgi:predicted RNase H-like HicB family nuclease